MDLLLFKISAAVVIFLAALFAGMWPIRTSSTEQSFFALGDAFASGIFLGAGAFHMFPEAVRDYRLMGNPHPLGSAILFCALGIILFTLLERTALMINKKEYQDHHPLTGYILATILSIHSLVEGAALGINSIFADAFMIFIAIIAHKGSASFALAITLRKASFSRMGMQTIVFLFALMTPIGIIVAAIVDSLLQSGSGLEASFNSFAAGTFLYIGSIRIIHSQFRQIRQKWNEILMLSLGILMMIIIGIWL